jgi:hypothetical protein
MAARKAELSYWAGETSRGCTYDMVQSPGMLGFSLCTNGAKHDPDDNGDPTRCGVHSEAATERRNAKQKKLRDEQTAKWARSNRLGELRRELSVIVKQIAEGHNDPRALCQDWIVRNDAAKGGET